MSSNDTTEIIEDGVNGVKQVNSSNGVSSDKSAMRSGPGYASVFNPKCWFEPEKLHPAVSELVYWRDPKKSGVVFGSAFLVLIFLTFASFISVLAYSSLLVLSGTLGFRVYKMIMQAVQKTNDGHPFKELLESEVTISDEKAQEISAAVLQFFNNTAQKLRSLFLVEDVFDTLKFAGVLYLLTYVGSWFNGLTLIILALIAMFATPKVYEANKTVIDQYLELLQAKYAEVATKVTALLPFGKKDKAQ